jgi:adenylate cyclase
MADIFISYARPDEVVAALAAEALRGAGFKVWRDDDLPAHRAYAEVIEERLNDAKAVVVLWSAHAAKSQWVRAEADTARNAGRIIQATLDGTIPPIPFNQIQCADLDGWTGDPAAPGWAKLISSVAALTPKAVKESPPKKTEKSALSVCVLPFQNMSGEPEQEYFSDGICEDITTDLSKVSALGVTSRNTAFTFKGQSVNVCEVADRLGVSHVLEGSVRKAGNRVRITAQLIDGGTGDHVWADRYDRDLDDIFAIQDEISKAIVGALKVKLLPKEKKAIERRGTTNVEAYNMYLLARQFWLTGNYGDKGREQRVMRICSRAVEIDPNYADAWALLANAQSNLRYFFMDDIDDGFAAAHAALSIDPTIAEAYCPLTRRLQNQGRLDEALVEIAKALEINPESWEVNKEAGRLAMLAKKVEEASRRYELVTELMEEDFHAWTMLSCCYHSLGNSAGMQACAAKMISESEKALIQDPSNGAALASGASGLAIMGQKDRAREWMAKAILLDPENFQMRYNCACVALTYLDDKATALTLLEFPLTRSRIHVIWAASDPDLDSIRTDPKFVELMDRGRTKFGLQNQTHEV